MLNFFCVLIVSTLNVASASQRPIDDGWTKTGDWIQVLLPLSTGIELYRMGDSIGFNSYSSAVASTLAQTHALKYLVDAKRPYGGRQSFPSGHMSLAFSSPSYIFFRYGFRAAVIDGLLAGYVGYTRVYGRYHYLRDVLAGGLISALNQYFFMRHYRLSVIALPKGVGLRFNLL